MRQLLVRALGRLYDVTVREAADGQEALGILATTTVDLLVTDINMPVMNGLKLIEQVRANPALSGLPILVITTEGEERDRDHALNLGASAYVTKPIQASQVVAQARLLLGSIA